MQNFLNSRQKMATEPVPMGAFKPMNQNTNLSKVEVVSEGKDQPKVELVTDGGTIRSIFITCKCGERIELKCSY